jgi:hypothetical protein
MILPSTAIELSENSKLKSKSKKGFVSATYASQRTCPKTCFFRNSGCYAEIGWAGCTTNRINKSPIKDPVKIARIEAAQIMNLTGKNPLRLHVVGDCPNRESTIIIANAAKVYSDRYNKPVYTYTHNRTTDRTSWGVISVLRSCETVRQCQQAHIAGFASALVVPEFKQDTRYYIGRGMYGIPCLVQTGKAESCLKCGLCFNDSKLHGNHNVILFHPHGTFRLLIKDRLSK